MILKTVAEQKAINKYARQFVKSFKPFIDEQIKVKLGHQGASYQAKVLWSKRLGIWFFSRSLKKIRYWNAFGVGKPVAGSLVSITCEINFPWQAIDRKTGGAFARDYSGNVFVIHRGKIGGGKKGVGKSLFEHNYRGVWSLMEDGDSLNQVAVIGALNSSRFALQVAQFVKKIELLKSAAGYSAQTEIMFSETTFRNNLIGYLPVQEVVNLTAQCDRDLIIKSLAGLLKRWKFKVGNDGDHVLFVMDQAQNHISHFFEVVTDVREEKVLAAAARLLSQKAAVAGNPLAILVVPEDIMTRYTQMLESINIAVITFRLEGEKIIFPDLGKIKLDQNQ